MPRLLSPSDPRPHQPPSGPLVQRRVTPAAAKYLDVIARLRAHAEREKAEESNTSEAQ